MIPSGYNNYFQLGYNTSASNQLAVKNVINGTVYSVPLDVQSQIDALNSKFTASEVTDLNDAIGNNKVYLFNTGAANNPGYNYGLVHVWSDGNNTHQLAVTRGGTGVGMSERSRSSNGTWGSWVKIPTRSEMDALINRGENLLNFSSYSDRTAAGVTFNKSGNVVIATGTGTNEDIVDIDRHLTLTAGTYCFGGVYGNTPWLQIMNDANTAQIGDSRNANPTLTFNSDTTIYVRFHVTNSVTYSGLMTPFLCRIS